MPPRRMRTNQRPQQIHGRDDPGQLALARDDDPVDVPLQHESGDFTNWRIGFCQEGGRCHEMFHPRAGHLRLQVADQRIAV